MGLKEYFASLLKKRKFSKVEVEVKSLIGLYTSKIALWNSFSAKKIDESTFKKRFLELLNADASFLIVEEKLLKNVEDENLKKEVIAWKTAIVKQQNALEKSDYNKLFAGIKEEANLLALENEEIKKLEQELQETKFSKKDIQKNLKELQKLEFEIERYSDLSLLLAQNWNLTQELIKKLKRNNVHHFFFYGLPGVANLIKSKEDLKVVVLLLIELLELVGKTKPENVYFLFAYGLPGVANLIKSKEDLKVVGLLLIVLLNKLRYEDIEVVFKYGLRFIKKISELENINISELIVRSHALYYKQKESFFSGERNIIRNEFEKTGSRTILLGGKLVGKVIIRIVTKSAFLSWKKALESENEWKKEGFDYIPVEPILTKNEKLLAFKTKKGQYRVYTAVLGQSLATFLKSSTNQYAEEYLINLRYKITRVLNKLKITHGHTHDSNFCVERKDNKLRLYIIDFDEAIS